MKKIFIFIFLLSSAAAFAQEDLMNMLNAENPEKPAPVIATFKSTRVVNLQSNETMKAKHLDFRIQHRFNPVNGGPYDWFGLDGAVLRLSLEYGITDRLMVGAGRNTVGKTFDQFIKYQLMSQETKGGNPLSISLFGSNAIVSENKGEQTSLFTSRLAYCAQVIFTRKMNDYVSFIVSPTMLHYNLVADASTPNDLFAVGLGGSFRISRSTRFNIEYIPRLNGRDKPSDPSGKAAYHDAVAFGFDIETGGHIFQLHFTNATGLIESQFAGRNPNPVAAAQLRFGFNISRTFSFDN